VNAGSREKGALDRRSKIAFQLAAFYLEVDSSCYTTEKLVTENEFCLGFLRALGVCQERPLPTL
jgi:hypothetical protein